MIKKENNQKFYIIVMIFKNHDVKTDTMRADNLNHAFDMFCDKYQVVADDVLSYKTTCIGELQEMTHNPYNFGKCPWQCFVAIKELPITATIKIDAIKNKLPKMYNVKTISQALCQLERDGYIKFESRNIAGENIYIKKGQVKE